MSECKFTGQECSAWSDVYGCGLVRCKDAPTTKPKQMSLDKAIERLKYHYERAEKMEHVHNKTAWALYRVWKEADVCEALA